MRGGQPVHIGKLVQDLLTRRGLNGSLQLQEVRRGVAEVSGEKLASRLQVTALRGGEATIEVDSASLCYELRGFLGARVLDELRKRPATAFVSKLKFKVGSARDDA